MAGTHYRYIYITRPTSIKYDIIYIIHNPLPSRGAHVLFGRPYTAGITLLLLLLLCRKIFLYLRRTALSPGSIIVLYYTIYYITYVVHVACR